MATILGILGILVGIVSLVCWIMVLIKMFSEEVIQGILGLICGLWAFIWGWMHADAHGLKQIMLIWTVCVVLSIVFNVGASALGVAGGLPGVPQPG